MNSAPLVMFSVLLVGLFLGVPIAWSIVLSCITALIVDGTIPVTILAQRLFTGADSFAMLAVPAFLLAGEIMSRGGISIRVVNFASSIVGGITGSLALVSIVACSFFASLSGSALATTAAIGSIMIPEMSKRGYPKDFSAAVQAIGGTLGPVIPPSIVMIFYGNSTGVSIAGLLISGVVPGIISCIGLCIIAYIIAKKRRFPKEEGFSWSRAVNSGKEASFALGTPAIILGGIYSGMFTPTESAGVAVVYSLIVAVFIFKQINLVELWVLFKDTAKVTANLLILVISAQLFGWLVAYFNIPDLIGDWIGTVASNEFVFFLLIDMLLFIAGMFMEAISIVVIAAPILHPLAMNYGIDPIHFGLVVVFALCLGIATPPFGPTTYVACGISKESIYKVGLQLLPFVAIQVIITLLLSFIPQLSLWLPRLMR
jgi:C4-dicarboxylate transporter, DctM subunit